jgi:hypothetical protein
MPLYAVLAREYFGQQPRHGARRGDHDVDPRQAARRIFDRFGGYAWLYISSFALGMGAVALALAFPPITRRVELRPA